MRAILLVLALLAAALSGCASKALHCAPVNPCGEVCCNDDGEHCTCPFEWGNEGWTEEPPVCTMEEGRRVCEE